MKINLKISKSIRYAGFSLFILVFVFTSIGAISPFNIAPMPASRKAIANYTAAQKNPGLTDEEKIKAAIDAYFTTRYEGQKLLVAQDFSTLVEDNTLDWVKKEKDKRDIELYIATLFDLRYVSYSYQLDYDTIEIKNNKATVQLRENHQVVFDAVAPETSKLSDLLHTFTLHNKKGVWLIYKDEYEDELSKQLNHMTKEEIKKQVDENFKNQHQGNIRNPIARALAMPLYVPMSLTTYAYNRTAAASYADTYWSSYNTSWYKTESGTDCANYVSEALYAGEGKTPPDTSGMTTSPNRSYYTDWYYVFNNPKGTQNGSGSLPWVRVQDQYSFIIGNTSQIGPYGWGGQNYLCYVQKGDVVQLYNVNGTYTWDHEGIVVVVNCPCTSLSNYLVDAHTTNRYHYPLSNWASFAMRYIIISGWRGN